MIIITASTTDQLDIRNWYNIVVTSHQNKVDMYIDDKRVLFCKVGFDWYLPFITTYSIEVIRNSYAKMFIQDEKRRKLDQNSKNKFELLEHTSLTSDQQQEYVYRQYLPKEHNGQQAGDVLLDGDFRILKVFPTNYHYDRPSLETLGI